MKRKSPRIYLVVKVSDNKPIKEYSKLNPAIRYASLLNLRNLLLFKKERYGVDVCIKEMATWKT